MVDAIRVKWEMPRHEIPIEVAKQIKQPFEYLGIEFYPKQNGFVSDNSTISKTGLKGMRLNVHGQYSPYLTLSNSLHKLWQNGVNHTDFRHTEIAESIEYLSDILGYDMMQAKFEGKQEFAMNILFNNPLEYCKAIIGYKKAEVEKMRDANKQYGAKVFLGKYSLKNYSPHLKSKYEGKTPAQLLPPENILRCEWQIQASYAIQRSFKAHVLKDFTDKDLMRRIGLEMVKMEECKILRSTCPKDLTTKELETVLLMENATSEQRVFLSRNDTKAYKLRQKRMKQLKPILDKHNQRFRQVPSLMESKWLELLES